MKALAGDSRKRPFAGRAPARAQGTALVVHILRRMNEKVRSDLLLHARDAVLGVLPDVRAVYLYGSVARGDAGPHSDLDLAVLLPPGCRLERPWHLAGQLAGTLGRDVDLVDLGQVGDVLRMQVLQDGVMLYNARPGEVLAWEAGAMTRYGHYRREVSDLVKDFRKTGIGYGPTPP